MLGRKKSGRTYSLTSYTGVGLAPPNSPAANPAAVAAASSVGHALNKNAVSSSNKHSVLVDRRHSAVGTTRSPSLTSNTKRFSTGPPTVKTTTKRIVNPDRSFSLTTTTTKNLGKFEITTTKTTPLKPPPQEIQKKQCRKSSMRPPASGSIHESDLESVKEDSLITLTPPRKAANPKISFSPVTSIDEQEEPVRHSPPPRSLSPSKPALKDNSRASSLNSGSTLQVPKRRHSVSFTDLSESKLSSATTLTNQMQQKRHSSAAGHVHAAANAVKSNGSPTTPHKSIKNSNIQKSNSPNTVNTSLGKVLGLPIQTKRQTVKERGEERHAGTFSGASLQRKSSVTENTASTAARKIKNETVKINEHNDNSKLAAAASSVVISNHHIPAHNNTSTKHTHTTNNTKPVATAAAIASNNHFHHYRALAYGDDTGAASAAAAADKNINGSIKLNSTDEAVDEEYPAPIPIYSSEEDDVISMSSESSWRRSHKKPASGLNGFKKSSGTKSKTLHAATTDSAANVPASPTKAFKVSKPTQTKKKGTANNMTSNGSSGTKPRPKSFSTSSKTQTQQTALSVAKREPQHILKRTPSVSSFERENSGNPGSAFKLMSLRDRTAGKSTSFSSNISSTTDTRNTMASSGLVSSSSFGSHPGFSSRFADSDSEDEMTTANTRANVGTPRFIPANIAVEAGIIPSQQPQQQHHSGRKFFKSSHDNDLGAAGTSGLEEKKKRFKGLRKVLGLKY